MLQDVTWLASENHTFSSEVTAVNTLLESRGLWWCCHCDKPLFIGRSPCVRL